MILFFLYLIGERLALERSLRRIPLRIAITGTRGKTSLTRLLASILQEDGRRVIAKTTGSEAVILLPDGGRIELNRDVTPSNIYITFDGRVKLGDFGVARVRFLEERDDPLLAEFPRLIFHFNSRSFGRLRQLIDAVNGDK